MNAKVEISDDSNSIWTPNSALCEEWVNTVIDVAGRDSDCLVSIRYVDRKESQALNTQYRGRESATNVLSFPADFPSTFSDLLDYQLLGDIVLCAAVVEQQAEEQGKALEAHWAHLLIHGTLHLLGFDHESPPDAESMEKLEIIALEKLGIANPYLVG